MIDLKYIRENINEVKKSTKQKGCDVDFDSIIILDDKRRELIIKVEKLKAERNKINQEISNLIKNKMDASSIIINMKAISEKIKTLDEDLGIINTDLNEKINYIPNIPHVSVPLGKDQNDNIVVREWGEKPIFDFKVMDHKYLCEQNSLIDFKRAAKISGTGFPLYTKKGAKLERALINYMLDKHEESGYEELFPPFLVSSNSPYTTGNLPKFKDDMYHIKNDDLYLIPTAEVPVTNIYSNEIINEDNLPIKFAAYSACFRREAGSYGKDTKGLLRLHQFNKVEMVKFVKPETSYDELELLLNNAENILQELNLHYRVIELCTGDLSFSAAKCYDIEVWSPFENKYLEVSSCSNFESFQSRRGNIKYRNKSKNKLEFIHTLNGSGLATPRLMVSLLETYQNSDNSINIPDILKPYLKFDLINEN